MYQSIHLLDCALLMQESLRTLYVNGLLDIYLNVNIIEMLPKWEDQRTQEEIS